MIVKPLANSGNFLFLNMMKKVCSIAIAIGLLMVIAAFTMKKAGKSEFDAAKEVIVMRNIAHQILRYTGDSTSQIAPVSRISASEFQIPFESSFSFKPDSLVHIIDKVIADNKLPSRYVVNVLDGKTDTVRYGYVVMGPQEESIKPCMGRDQPARPYCIDIRFEEDKGYTVKGLYIGGISIFGIGLLLLGVGGYKKQKHIPQIGGNEIATTEKAGIEMGRYLFFAGDQILKFDEEETVLTVKEAKILSIFANTPNQVIDRKRLQKEIWEDEGVIVGRSLDMFISRLRKRLESDPDIKLVNIHGKGYKLEINSDGI
ncbi:MAG: transcriptional regulator, winged helix family [Bacteroidetes bacterium]|nr:transcriptional regulator, winged helix family [Bacteroidota bacterium]